MKHISKDVTPIEGGSLIVNKWRVTGFTLTSMSTKLDGVAGNVSVDCEGVPLHQSQQANHYIAVVEALDDPSPPSPKQPDFAIIEAGTADIMKPERLAKPLKKKASK